MGNKTTQIIEILETVTQREIAKRVGCTEGYVSKVKRGITKPPETTETPETIDNVDPDDTEYETETSNFVKKVKIIPPKETLTETEDEPDTDEEYECGSCGHVWTADKTEYQKSCPKCGEEF